MAAAIGCAALLAATAPSMAQPVYKCKEGEAVTYSNEACLNARTVEVVPTTGLDGATGWVKQGPEPSAEEQRRRMAETLPKLLGGTPEEYEKRVRRFPLPDAARRACAKLDREMPAQEAAAESKEPAAATQAVFALYESRKKYRDLGC